MSADAQQTTLPTGEQPEYPCVHCGGPTPGADTTNNDQCPECLDAVRAGDAGGRDGVN